MESPLYAVLEPDGESRTQASCLEITDENSNVDVLDRCAKEVSVHLRNVLKDMQDAIDEETRNTDEQCASMKTAIENEAEREIEKILARKEARLKENNEKAKEQHQLIVERKRELIRQIQSLGEDIRSTLEKLKTRHHGSSAAKVNANIDQLLAGHESKEVAKRYNEKRSLSGGLFTLANKVTKIASNVAFVRVKGTSVGRVDGARDRWVLEEEIDVAPINVPVMKGAISDHEVVIEDLKTSLVYVTDVREKTTTPAMADKLQLFNCTALDDGTIMCGTRDGSVLLYDRSWELVRRVTLPEKLHKNETMCVAVGQDGTMYIAKYGSNHIHVYHPSGSRWLRTIDVGDMVPIHGIHILSSGIVVHSAMYGEQVCLMDADGTSKSNVYLEESEDKCLSVLAANYSTDSLYNVSSSSSSGLCVVEELLNIESGDIMVKKLVEFPAPRMSNGLIGAQRFCPLQSNRMVACDGNRVLVFGKREGVEKLPKIAS